MPVPFIRLTGTPYAQGLAHGRALSSLIERNVATYFRRLRAEAGLDRAAVLDWAARYGDAIAADDPDYADGIRGIADGAGRPLAEIAALAIRYELLYADFAVVRSRATDGCTAFAVLPDAAAAGHLLCGQNWDWIPGVAGALVHTTEPDGLSTLAFTEAGIFGGKIGLNSAGIALAINGLSSAGDDVGGLARPFHVRCRAILRSRDLDEAVAAATAEPRGMSANYLIAGTSDRAVDIETAPNATRTVAQRNGWLVHTNHFLRPADMGVVDTVERPHTYSRYRRMGDLLGAAVGEGRRVSADDICAMLRDHVGHPTSICRHGATEDPPGERYETVASIVMDLADRTLRIASGPPCENGYAAFRLSSLS